MSLAAADCAALESVAHGESRGMGFQPMISRAGCPCHAHWLERAGVLAELTKPRLTALAVLSALAGYYLAADSATPWAGLVGILIGACLVGGGANALNQYFERDLDARMRRTATRPLPSGRLAPETAFCFGAVLATTGVAFFTIQVNPLTGLVALAILASYLFVYTPLKRVSGWSTLAGTVPGALPIVMGWTAAGRELSVVAWALFALVALWQLPHFFAIGWLHRDDYHAAGFPVWPIRDASGRKIALSSAALCAGLVPLTLLPSALNLTGATYAVAAIVLGLAFAAALLLWAARPSLRTARAAFRASIFYLPLLFLAMVADKL